MKTRNPPATAPGKVRREAASPQKAEPHLAQGKRAGRSKQAARLGAFRGKKEYSRPLGYINLLPAMARAAEKHGYVIALHGSLHRDFDLLAVPWVEGATDCESLIASLVDAAGGRIEKKREARIPKPHGRLAWLIDLGGGDRYIDVSVMPRQNDWPRQVETARKQNPGSIIEQLASL